MEERKGGRKNAAETGVSAHVQGALKGMFELSCSTLSVVFSLQTSVNRIFVHVRFGFTLILLALTLARSA